MSILDILLPRTIAGDTVLVDPVFHIATRYFMPLLQ